jgi:zinc protease
LSILSNVTGYIKSIGQVSPIKFLRNSLNTFIDKVSFGRGLKFWSAPQIRAVDSKKDFTEYQLQNGLKVIFKKSKGAKLKTQLTIHSGSAKDPKGRSGLAHFLEHIVVSNTAEFQDDLSKVININGGSFNAFTSSEQTTYPLQLPKDKLDLALRIYRGYMSPPRFDEKVLTKEKAVIHSELKMVEASPVRKGILKIQEAIFGKEHPLSRPPIGDNESIQAINQDDLQRFFKSEYVPNNATLSISGDLNDAQVKKLIEKYFADLEANPNTKRPDFSKTFQASSQNEILIKDSTLNTEFNQIYKINGFNHKENLILSLVTAALAKGDRSRLVRKLIDGEVNNGKAVATSLVVSPSMSKDYGYFVVSATPLSENVDQNTKIIEKVVNDELEDIAQNGLKETELKRIVQELELSEIYQRDDNHANLGLVTNYALNDKDWKQALDYLDDIRSITNDDIKSFVGKFLNASNRKTLKIFGHGNEFTSEYKKSLTDVNPGGVISQEQSPDKLDSLKLEQIKQLAGGLSNFDVKLTDLKKYKLDNGMKVYLKEDHDLPIAFTCVDFMGGQIAFDVKDQLSIRLLESLVSEVGIYKADQAKHFDKQALEAISTHLGTAVKFSSGVDYTSIEISTLTKNYDKAMVFIKELFTNTALLETKNLNIVKIVNDKFSQIKKTTIDSLEKLKKESVADLSRTFLNSIYPKNHHYHKLNPDEAINYIKSMTLDDLRSMYDRVYNPKDAFITAVGNLTRANIDNSLVPVLDSLSSCRKLDKAVPDYSKIAPVEAQKSSLQFINSNDTKPESSVIIGNPTEVLVDSPEYYPSKLANAILGESFSSRLFADIRERQGLVYRIGSNLTSHRKGSGPFQIQLSGDPRNLKKTIAATCSCVNKFLYFSDLL